MGAGGVHDTYSGPRWVQLLPPPPTSGQCGPSRLFYPRRCHRSAASFSPTAGVGTPCVLPSPPPSLQPQYGPVIPVIPVPIRGSERSLRAPPPHRGPHRPRGMGGLRDGDTEGDPKAEWDPWRHSGLGMGTAVRTPPAQGGLPGGGGSAGGEHADHHHPPVAAGPDCLWAALPGAAGTPPRRSRFPVHPLVPRMLPPASPRCPQCSLPVL